MFLKVLACLLPILSLAMGQFGPDPTLYGESILSDKYIDYLNGLNSTWKAGRNFAVNTPIEHLRTICGSLDHLRFAIPNTPRLIMIHDEIDDNQIPKEFDSRVEWPKCETIGIIRDQGSCGSCWAFGAIEAISDRICVASNQQINVMISAEDLTTCCGLDCGGGCEGGFSQAAWEYWLTNGLVSGGLYNDTKTCRPYTIPPCEHTGEGPRPKCDQKLPTPPCKKECQPAYKIPFEKDRHFGKNAYTIFSVKDAQIEIMTNGPIEASFFVYDDFFNYKSGVYQYKSGDFAGGHCVKIFGWGEENNTPYWLAANSWNTDWGDEGYFKILRGKDECQIESYLVAGLPKLN